MHIISISNQKGGVAKTTTAVNLAACLGDSGKKVLLIDLDPQANATMGCGIKNKELENSILDICLAKEELTNVILRTEYKNLFIAPSTQDLTVAEVKMPTLKEAPFILKKALLELKQNKLYKFDYVVIDCPPALNILSLNAMTASDSITVPIQCEYYALEGLNALLDTISDLQKSTNKELTILGFLRTMFDGRSNLTNDVSDQLVQYLGEKVFKTIIPRNVTLAEAPSYGIPILYYDKSSKGAKAYTKLAKEIIKKIKKNKGEK